MRRHLLIDAAALFVALMPAGVDAAWLRAQTLAADLTRRDEAIAFVDAHRARLGNPAELLTAKAYTFYVLSSATTPRDDARLTQAFDTYAEARQADPNNVNAHYLPGTYLTSLKRTDEAYELLKKAVALAPGSRDVHQTFSDSPEAEWVLIGRLREFHSAEALKKPEYRQLLRDYVARPKHYHEGLLGETYRSLFFDLVGDASVGDAELLRVADGMTK